MPDATDTEAAAGSYDGAAEAVSTLPEDAPTMDNLDHYTGPGSTNTKTVGAEDSGEIAYKSRCPSCGRQ